LQKQDTSQNGLDSIEDVFDDIPDALFASIPEIHISAATTDQSDQSPMYAAATEVNVSAAAPELPAAATELPAAAPGPKMFNGPRMLNGSRMLNGPPVTIAAKLKNTVQKVKKRTSDRLRKLKTKLIKGPGATADAPMVIDESEEGVLTQEGTAEKEGVVLPYMRTMPTLVAEK
jgi:hypothetical protein